MAKDGDENMADATVNPAALTVAQVAKILSAVGSAPVTEDMLRRHIAGGAPTDAGGCVNLVHYAAWLIQRIAEESHSAAATS